MGVKDVLEEKRHVSARIHMSILNDILSLQGIPAKACSFCFPFFPDYNSFSYWNVGQNFNTGRQKVFKASY